jgi:hypothetical protein
MYHVPAHTATWQPEVVVQFERWLALRARIEQAWLRGDTAQVYAGCPDSTLLTPDSAYVMCDGPYIAHVRDPGTAPPNLARVQEIAAGMWRTQTSAVIDQAELWVDDIRLGDVVREAGAAGSIDIAVAAADVADLAISVSRRDGQFRQLTQFLHAVGSSAAAIGGTHLGRPDVPGPRTRVRRDQHAVDHAEDGGRRADTQHQREQRYQREGPAPPERPERVAQILKGCFQPAFHDVFLCNWGPPEVNPTLDVGRSRYVWRALTVVNSRQYHPASHPVFCFDC